jgi:hypothetical protein
MPVDAKVWATPKLTRWEAAGGQTDEREAIDAICPVCAECCRCNNLAQHSNQSPKLSVVRDLQRRHGRRRHKLRLHNISTMHGHGARVRQLLSAEYAIPASARTTCDGSLSLSILAFRSCWRSAALVFGEQLGLTISGRHRLLRPKCAGYSPAFNRFCVMAQGSVMEFCGNPIF